MSLFKKYLLENKKRKILGLDPKPIDDKELLDEIIEQIKTINHEHRTISLDFFIYNVLPGTTDAAKSKSNFLKEIILSNIKINEISIDFAFELLSHMKGGPSVEVLLDIALKEKTQIAKKAASILKKQVFLYEADMSRLNKALKEKNDIAIDILTSYSKAEFFTTLPEIPEEIKVVTFVAGVGDISTDLFSPGSDADS